MTERFIALIALLVAATPVQAHQIWIEQSEGQNAVVRFGEFGENLREASPGLLDKFAKVTGTLVSAKGEQKSDATKTANGFSLPFSAASGEGIVAQDANYPLYTWKQQGKDTTNWFCIWADYSTVVVVSPGDNTKDITKDAAADIATKLRDEVRVPA